MRVMGQIYFSYLININFMSQRKAWTCEEDKALKELYEVRGVKKWAQISRLLQKEYAISHRNGKQCRQRYHNHLDSSIRRDKWTSQEQKELLELQNQCGNHWAQITKGLKGRSQNGVKNQFYCILRRGIRKINRLMREKLKRYKQIGISIVYKLLDDDILQKYTEEHINIKRQLLYFSMNEVNHQDVQLEKAKVIIKKLKGIQKMIRGRKKKEASSQHEQSQMDSDVYMSQIPQQIKSQKKNSLYEFHLEDDEEPEEKQVEKEESSAQHKIYRNKSLQQRIKKSFSLQSFGSLGSRISRGNSRMLDLLGTQVNLQEHNRFSPYIPGCDSPYFDRLRSSFSAWQTDEK